MAIEILVALLVVKIVNCIPKAQTNVNIMRVREHFLKDQAKLYRQTIVLSSFATPEMKSLFSSFRNLMGKIQFKEVHEGVMAQIQTPIKHLFERHSVHTVATISDDRLVFFKETIIPRVSLCWQNLCLHMESTWILQIVASVCIPHLIFRSDFA